MIDRRAQRGSGQEAHGPSRGKRAAALFDATRRAAFHLLPGRDISAELAERTGHEPTVETVNQWGLVLASKGIPYRLSRHGHLARLSVSRRFHVAAIDTILAEPHDGTAPAQAPPRADAGDPAATLLIIFGLLVFHGLTQGWWIRLMPPEAWLEAGALDAAAVWERHEWYRVVTALTLHAGSLHLFSNLLFGAIVMLVLCRRTGTALGWAAALLAGVIGNIAMLFLRHDGYVSVGFSTAIFGGMGVLCGLETTLFRSQGIRAFLVPLAVGGAWLGLLGGASPPPEERLEEPFSPLPVPQPEQMDVGAHFTGFLAGLPIGALAGLYLGRHHAPSGRAGALIGALALAVVCAAWAAALASSAAQLPAAF